MTFGNIYGTIMKKWGEAMKNTEENIEIAEKQSLVRQQLVEQYTEYRKIRNMTQEQLAYAMGIKRPNISRFEKGQCNPTLDLLVRMAECMDLEIRIDLIDKQSGKILSREEDGNE